VENELSGERGVPLETLKVTVQHVHENKVRDRKGGGGKGNSNTTILFGRGRKKGVGDGVGMRSEKELTKALPNVKKAGGEFR